MPLLFPLIIGGAGALGLGTAAGFTLSNGAEKVGEGLKWLVIGAGVVGAIGTAIYLARK